MERYFESGAVLSARTLNMANAAVPPCSAIRLPASDYPLWDALPEAVVAEGKLSQLQLEGVLYACTKHQQILMSGERAHTLIRSYALDLPCRVSPHVL